MRPNGGKRKLESFAEKKIGDYAIHVSEIEPERLAGPWRFTLRLKDKFGRKSAPMIRGRYFEGRGWIRPWIEVNYRGPDFCGTKVDIPDAEVFSLLARILPAGGHIMVKYDEHIETARALALNVPPPATFLGFLLWQAGFRWFKDWYFPEGWNEGEQKLQGNKPLNKTHERKRLREVGRELNAFIYSEFDWNDELLRKCRGLALEILRTMNDEKKTKTGKIIGNLEKIVRENVKPSQKGFAVKSVREDRDSH